MEFRVRGWGTCQGYYIAEKADRKRVRRQLRLAVRREADRHGSRREKYILCTFVFGIGTARLGLYVHYKIAERDGPTPTLKLMSMHPRRGVPGITCHDAPGNDRSIWEGGSPSSAPEGGPRGSAEEAA